MKKVTLEKFIEERIKENKGLFTVEEMICIEKNKGCINKIYLLGAKNSKETFEKECI